MGVVVRYVSNRQRGIGPFAGLFPIGWLILFSTLVFAAQNNHVKILYFFSPSCKYCIDAKPYILDLSKEYGIEGQRFGEGTSPSFPFPVKAGDKKLAQGTYGVQGIPTLAVLVDGVYRQKIAGMTDIRDAKVIIKGLVSGAMTVTEAAQKVNKKEIIVTGWIIAKGEYFKNARFFLTDRSTEIPLKAWLPLELVKSSVQKKKLKLMSDMLKKPIVLKGSIKKTTAGNIFFVKAEVPVD
jgi:thiol-disulfide isomerase/thioredoxin